MAEVIATDQLDVPGFKRKPQIECPAHGLVINPSTGLVAVWSPDVRTAGDILETYDANKHVEATVPDDIRQAGLRVAARYAKQRSTAAAQPAAQATSPGFSAPVGFTLPAGFQPLPQTVSNW